MCKDDVQPPQQGWTTPECLRPKAPADAVRGDLVVEEFPLTFEDYTYPHSRIAYIKGRQPAPVVLVHHNYAGLKQFDIDQACFLARAGFVGLALDSYKEKDTYQYKHRNPTADDGEEGKKNHFMGAFEMMNDLLWAPRSWRDLMGAYLEAAFKHPMVADGLAGAIGYCLGGQACLEQLRAGHGLQVIVSFHGLLNSRPMYKEVPDCYNPLKRLTPDEYKTQVDVPENKYSEGCMVVIENGGADNHVPGESIVEWMLEMDFNKVDWRFNNHARTPHGWALGPGVTATEYQEVADRRSTMSMLQAFAEAWPDFRQFPVEFNACGTALSQLVVPKVLHDKGSGKGKGEGKASEAEAEEEAPAKGRGKRQGKGAGGKGKGKWKPKAAAE